MVDLKAAVSLLALLFTSWAAPAAADVFINAGGPAMGAYVADRNFSGGGAYAFGTQTGVYNTERWSATGFSYAIPVTPGSVEVTLRFRESCVECPYKRVLRVQAEGQTVLSNFSVPLNTVGDQVFRLNSDATLNLAFTMITGEAWVNAIEVRQLSTPLPVVSLTATPPSVTSGGSSMLAWTATNATDCTASGAWSGSKATSGSQGTGVLGADSTYTLTCNGAGGSTSASVKVTVTAIIPVPLLTLTATPSSIMGGSAATLSWTTLNATSCTASGAWTGSKATSGTQNTGVLSVTTAYSLTCSGPGGAVVQTATVTVTPSPAPSLTFGANPTAIASGSSSTLTWATTNATQCTASGRWSGTKATNGFQSTGTLTTDATYTLTCTGPGGSVSKSATVTAVPRPTLTLSASPTSAANGGSSTLTWVSTNAASCTASDGWSGSKATNGSEVIGPLSATATYTLTCTGIGGSRVRSASVTVSAPVTAKLTALPTSVTSGGTSILTWSSTGASGGCTAGGAWSGSKATSGSQTVGPLSAASTYTLTCSNGSTSATGSATVNVTAPPVVPAVSLAASPATIASGESSTLNWTSSNVSSCTASGAWSGSRSATGSESTGALAASTYYTLTCDGPNGSASATVNVSVADNTAFPVHVETGKRYLVDALGRPFLIHGDTPWSLIVQLTREDADKYLEDRRAKGFNTIMVNLIEHRFAANAPLNRYGEGPFDIPGDFSTPNERYFAHADYVIAKAAEKGLLVLLAPAYAGYAGQAEGWLQEMQANGTTKLRAYGQYVGNRYKGFTNILWVQGGDYDVPNKDLVRAVANGIRDISPQSVHTYHGARGTGAFEFFGTTEPWLQLNNIYTNSTYVVSEAYQEYRRSSAPFFLIEADYENYGVGELGVRAQAWQAVLSGASGQMMGNFPLWHFNSPTAENPSGQTWQQALNSPGARSMQKMRELLGAYAWWILEPDMSASLVTAGLDGTANRLAAARAGDGSFAIVYVPSRRSITVNTTTLAGPRIAARWCDPANGACSAVAGSPFAVGGSRAFEPVGYNSSGNGDWLLVLESTP